MAYDPCPSCGSTWYAAHFAGCKSAAEKFLRELATETRWSQSEDFPRCPKCGYGTEDWHEFVPRYAGDGDSVNVTCAACEHEYPAQMVVSYSFRIKPPSPQTKELE